MRILSCWHINKYGLKLHLLWTLELGLVKMYVLMVLMSYGCQLLYCWYHVGTRETTTHTCVTTALKRKVFPSLQSVPVLMLLFELSRGPDEALGGNIGWIKLKHGTVERAEQSMNVYGGVRLSIYICVGGGGVGQIHRPALRVSNFTKYTASWTLSKFLCRAPIHWLFTLKVICSPIIELKN